MKINVTVKSPSIDIDTNEIEILLGSLTTSIRAYEPHSTMWLKLNNLIEKFNRCSFS